MRRFKILVLAVVFSSGVSFAAATVEQKSQVRFGGFIGGMANVFGGKATREGVNTVSTVRGERRLSVTGKLGELVDLKEEKIYQINFDRKIYQVFTFAELRKQFEDAQAQARQQSAQTGPEQEQGVELEFDVDVKDTGAKETINGHDTRQVIVTITAREKGRKLEESGGAVLTADLWLGPRIAALRELEEFERRYMEKLYGDLFGGGDMRGMAMLSAMAPSFGKAMQKLHQKRGTMQGTAIRSSVKFETVAGARSEASAASGGDTAARMVGGLLAKARKRDAGKEGESAAGRRMLFSSTSELIRAEPEADASALSIPSGFTQRK